MRNLFSKRSYILDDSYLLTTRQESTVCLHCNSIDRLVREIAQMQDKSSKTHKVNVRRTPIVDYREIIACLVEEEYDYEESEDEYSDNDNSEHEYSDGGEVAYDANGNIYNDDPDGWYEEMLLEQHFAKYCSTSTSTTYNNDINDEKLSQAATVCSSSISYIRKPITINDFLVIYNNNDKFPDVDNVIVSLDKEASTKSTMRLPPPIKAAFEEHNNTVSLQLPTHIKVTSLSVEENMLRMCYGANYSEAESVPRKFAVSYGSGKEGLSFLLMTVLLHDKDNKDGTTTLKINGYGVEQLKVPDGQDCFDFREIVRPLIVLDPSNNPTFKLRHLFNFESSGANFIETKLLTFADLFKKEGQQASDFCKAELIDSDCFLHGQMCRNCSEEKDSFTTLIQCGHSFCDQCFKDYIEVSSKKLLVCCMEYQCPNPIDEVTALSFMEPSSKSLKLFTWKGLDFILKDDHIIKECPTPGCQGKAFKATTDKETVNGTKKEKDFQVQCGFCKTRWCFECQQTTHWPLSCNIAEMYREHKSDVNESLFKVKDLRYLKHVLKRCPTCAVIIEKNGGCENVFCTQCRRHFNWNKALTKVDVTKFLFDTATKASMRIIRVFSVTNREAISEAYENGKNKDVRESNQAFYNLMLKVNDILESLHVLTRVTHSRYQRRKLVLHLELLKSWMAEGKTLLASDSASFVTKTDMSILSRKILVCMNMIIAQYC